MGLIGWRPVDGRAGSPQRRNGEGKRPGSSGWRETQRQQRCRTQSRVAQRTLSDDVTSPFRMPCGFMSDRTRIPGTRESLSRADLIPDEAKNLVKHTRH